MDISIIIVHYKTLELTSNCIESIIQSELTDIKYEIILIDNASNDGSIEAIEKDFKSLRIIKNKENYGFSKANNQGILAANGRYILLLNSDTLVEYVTIKKTLRFMDNHRYVGVLGCKVLLENGNLDPSCKRSFPTPQNSLYHFLKLDTRFPKNRRFGEYNLTYIDDDTTFSVDCIMGAFMLVRREVIEKVGLLDEMFFMYGEDIDWCYRIKKMGFQIIYYPKVKIYHYKKASGIGKKNPKVIKAFYDSMGLFFKKHYKGKYNPLITGVVLVGTKFLKTIALIKNGIGK